MKKEHLLERRVDIPFVVVKLSKFTRDSYCT